MNIVLPGLAVLVTAVLGFRGGAAFAPTAALPIPIGLAFAALVAGRVGSESLDLARPANSAGETARGEPEATHPVDLVSRAVTKALAALDSQVAGVRGAVIDTARASEATSRAIDGLASRASEIGEIIGLVQAIAAETNVLALNATIEAARAGEAGRGFAAVARDVKALSRQTERATGRIAERVAALQRATTSAVEAVATVGASARQAEELTEGAAALPRTEIEPDHLASS